MAIKYTAYDETGERVTGILEVDSEAAAERMLWESNLTIASLKGARRAPSKYELFPTLFKVKPRDLISLAQELAFLLDSGISLLPALKLLLPRVRNPCLRIALDRIIQDIESGNPLSLALSKHPDIFPSLFTRLLTAGEETGKLADMLHRVAAYMEKQESLTQKVKKATTYPAMVFIFGIIGVAVLVIFALPPLTTLYGEFDVAMPLAPRMLIAASHWLESYGKYVFLGLAIIGIGGWRYTCTPGGKRRWDYLVLRMPRIGKLVGSSNLARFTSTVAVLLSAGLPFMEAMGLMRTISTNVAFADAAGEVQTDVLMGQPISEALSRHRIFPHTTIQMVSVAEQSGGLATSLEMQSKFYEEETDRAIASTTALIEPVAIAIVGILVGFVAVSMFTAIYSLVGAVG